MTLYPGGPRLVDEKYVLDDFALEDTLAEAIEEEMANLFQLLKDKPLPEVGKEDRRLLFTAIARGVLKYLEAHQADILAGVTIDHATGINREHVVSHIDLDIQLDKEE